MLGRAAYMREYRARRKRRDSIRRYVSYEKTSALKVELQRHGVWFDENWFHDPEKQYIHVVEEILLRAIETLEKYRLRNSES